MKPRPTGKSRSRRTVSLDGLGLPSELLTPITPKEVSAEIRSLLAGVMDGFEKQEGAAASEQGCEYPSSEEIERRAFGLVLSRRYALLRAHLGVTDAPGSDQAVAMWLAVKLLPGFQLPRTSGRRKAPSSRKRPSLISQKLGLRPKSGRRADPELKKWRYALLNVIDYNKKKAKLESNGVVRLTDEQALLIALEKKFPAEEARELASRYAKEAHEVRRALSKG